MRKLSTKEIDKITKYCYHSEIINSIDADFESRESGFSENIQNFLLDKYSETDLYKALCKEREYQVEKCPDYFIFDEEIRTNIIEPHQFEISLIFDSGNVIYLNLDISDGHRATFLDILKKK